MARLCRGVILITRLNQFAIFLEKKQLRIYNFFFFRKAMYQYQETKRNILIGITLSRLEFRNV